MSNNQREILIVGAGIAGLSTAVALKRKGIPFRIFESAPAVKPVGSGLSLAQNAMKILHELGIGETVELAGNIVSGLIIKDENGTEISTVSPSFRMTFDGHANVAIHRARLHEILSRELEDASIFLTKKAIDFCEKDDKAIIVFEDGTMAEGSGIVAADGIHSCIRRKLLPASKVRYAGYTCWRGISDTTLSENFASELWGKAGRFGYVSIGDNKTYWFACKNAAYNDRVLSKWTCYDLLRNFKKYNSVVQKIILNTSDDCLIWNDIIDLVPLNRFAFGKILLVGDAAHAVTPNLGQGACLAIEDASILADLMVKGMSIENTWQHFESRRIKRTRFIANASLRVGKMAQLHNPSLVFLRNKMLRVLPDFLQQMQIKKILNL